MATVEQVARSALAAIDSSAILPLAAQWCSERLAEAAARTKFRFLRGLGAFVIPPVMQTGLVTVRRGSRVVIGDVVAQAAWSNALVGRFFQIVPRVTWTEIVAFDPSTNTLELGPPFAEEDVTAGAYRIVQRFATLDPQARKMGPFLFQRFRIPVELVAYERLQTLAPERQYFAFGPTIVAEAGEDRNGTKQVECYPYSIRSEQVTYVFWRRPPDLELHDLLPGAVDATMLKEGVLVDAMRYEWARAVREGKGDMAQMWAAQIPMQEARWRDRFQLIALQDNGTEDAQFILGSPMSAGLGIVREIRSAADEIFSRGRRP